ncbi:MULTISPECIES: hypothetical protein [unclassified Inquilinus]
MESVLLMFPMVSDREGDHDRRIMMQFIDRAMSAAFWFLVLMMAWGALLG